MKTIFSRDYAEERPLDRVYAILGFIVFWGALLVGLYTLVVVGIDAHNEAINYIDANITNVQ